MFKNLIHKSGDVIHCNPNQKHINQIPGSHIIDEYVLYVHECQGGYPNSQFQLNNGTIIPMQEFAQFSFCLSNNYVLYHFQDIYFAEYHSWMIDNVVYYIDFWSWRYREFDNPFHEAYDSALFVAGSFGTGYGDFLLGCLVRMIHFPRYLFPDSVILVYNHAVFPYCKEILDVMDIDGYKLSGAPWYHWDYAHNLYCLLPDYKLGDLRDVHQGYYGPMTTSFVRFLRDKYRLDPIVPFEYVIFNRGSDHPRGIANYDEVVGAMRREHPEHEYVGLSIYRTFAETSKAYAKIKWLFSGSGSNFMNAFFMAPGTGVLLFCADWFDYPAMCCPTCAGCVALGWQIRGVSHHGPAVTLNIDHFLRMVRYHFDMMESAKNFSLPGFAKELSKHDNATVFQRSSP